MLARKEGPDGTVVYRSPLLAAWGVPHAFTTRLGAPDEGASSTELARRLAGAAEASAATRVVDVVQVHGCEVVEVDASTEGRAREADALISVRADRLLLVRTADCVPILLARRDGARVGAVHAGWRGLVAGVVPRTLARLGPGEFAAAVGASICGRCFEVGPEVALAFDRAGLGSSVVTSPPRERPHVDLRAAVRLQLERGGVTLVEGTDRCTYEHEDELWSHRRDVTHRGAQATGRQLALIAARA